MKRLSLLLLLIALLVPFRAEANYTVPATIANGASLSAAVDLTAFIQKGKATSVAIIMPSAWTTANLTFFVSADGVNYSELYDGAGNEYTVNAAASRYILLDPSVFGSMIFLKIQSGTTGVPVAQGSARSLIVSLY